MDEIDRWIYLGGPEPEPVRTLLDTFRDLPPATPEDMARMSRAFFVRLDAKLRGVPPGPPAEQVRDDAPPVPPPAPRVRPIKLAQPDPEDAEPGTIAETPPPAPAPPAVAAPPSAVAPSALASTSLELNLRPLLERIGLPFTAPDDPRLPKPAGKTQATPVYRDPRLGETRPLDDTSLRDAKAAVPFVASSPGAGPTLGGMTCSQYASFRAVLDVWPEGEEWILVWFKVGTPDGRAVVDGLWQQHLARNPQARAAFQQDLAMFTADLHGRRQRGEPPPLL